MLESETVVERGFLEPRSAIDEKHGVGDVAFLA